MSISPRPATWLALVLMGAGGLAWWLGSASPTPVASGGMGAVLAAGAPAVLPAAVAAVAPGTPAPSLQREAGSLRGTELDGDWSLDAQGRLQPSLALRQRFDHLLLLRDGEASVASLAEHIRQQVEASAGADAARQVLDIWHRYVALLEMRFATVVDMNKPETWGPALAERQRARRDRLGLAWADAFYSEEEAALQALINAQTHAQTGAPGAKALAAAVLPAGVVVLGPNGPDRSTLSPEQRERLQAVDAEQARWAERLAEARREIGALRGAANLSDPQRREAIDAWLAPRFDALEQRRIRALLELPR